MSATGSATGSAPPPEHRRGGIEAWAPPVSAVAALAFAAPFVFGGRDFCLDDAWIHLAYARSLRLGEGLSYNPGDWETGFSSPLWLLLLRVWPTGSDPVVPVKLLGALLHAAGAWLAASVALWLGKARASLDAPLPLLSIALLAGVLVAAQPTLLQGATSGMEVALASALILGLALASLRDAPLVAASLGALAVLARPEALFFALALAGALALARRSWRPLAGLVGAALALALWVAYCLAVSGYPWPNTYYAKAAAGGGDGLAYLLAEVLPWQPWITGLTGVVLIGLALRGELLARPRRLELAALLLAWLLALLAVAGSRPLHVGVLFYESRYFAIFAALPPIAVAFGIAHARRWLAVALVVPIAVMSALQISDTHARQRAQERGIALLHGDPAHELARALPADAVVAVEGAGAARYFTPRTMTIVDALGLNDAAIAHAPDTHARVCALIARHPDHLAMPAQMADELAAVFELELVASFHDAAYAQVREPHPQEVRLLRVRGVRPRWVERCGTDGP